MNLKIPVAVSIILTTILAGIFLNQYLQQSANQQANTLPKISPLASNETLPAEIKKCMLTDLNVNYTNQVRKGILIIGFNQPLSDALVQDLIKAYPQYELKQSTQPDSSELVTFTTNAKDTYDTFKQRCYLKQHPTIMLVDFDYISLPW